MSEKERVILNEREKELLSRRKESCGIVGRKLYVIFTVSVISTLVTAILLVWQFGLWNTENGSMLPIRILAIAQAVLGIVFAVEIFSLGRFHEEYKMAGFAFVLATIAEIFKVLMFGLFGNIFLCVTAILNIVFVSYFSSAMTGVLENVDGYLGEGWEAYEKTYRIVMIALVVCTLGAIFTPLSGLAVMGILVLDFAAICIDLWKLYLLFESASAMTRYSRKDINQEESKEVSAT